MDSNALSGSVSDVDGLPNPPGVTTALWAQQAAPVGGTTTFGDPTSASTTVVFDTPGTYTLRLTADDSLLTDFDDVIVTVSLNPVNEAPTQIIRKHYSLGGVAVATRTVTDYPTQTDTDELQWIVADHLGSTSNVLSDTLQSEYQSWYYPYGEARGSVGTETGIDQTFTGQTNDPGTGLIHYNARQYDPVVGRFIQQDSIVPNPTSTQDLNRYTYVRNNPMSYVDPSGHYACRGLQDDLGLLGIELCESAGRLFTPEYAVAHGPSAQIVYGQLIDDYYATALFNYYDPDPSNSGDSRETTTVTILRRIAKRLDKESGQEPFGEGHRTFIEINKGSGASAMQLTCVVTGVSCREISALAASDSGAGFGLPTVKRGKIIGGFAEDTIEALAYLGSALDDISLARSPEQVERAMGAYRRAQKTNRASFVASTDGIKAAVARVGAAPRVVARVEAAANWVPTPAVGGGGSWGVEDQVLEAIHWKFG